MPLVALALSLVLIPDRLGDLHHFPPREIADANWRLAQSHLVRVGEMTQCYGSQHWTDLYDWHGEARYCFQCWTILDDAYRNSYPGRREKLVELKGLLGKEAYGSGRMPPVVPLWRFTHN